MNCVPTQQTSLQSSLDSVILTLRSQKTLMLVEDDAFWVQCAMELFRKFDCVLDIARDAEEALGLLRANPTGYKIAFIDNRLPKMDGINLISIIHFEFPYVCCVLTTGYIDRILIDACKGFGIAFIEKPLTLECLKRILKPLGINERAV